MLCILRLFVSVDFVLGCRSGGHAACHSDCRSHQHTHLHRACYEQVGLYGHSDVMQGLLLMLSRLRRRMASACLASRSRLAWAQMALTVSTMTGATLQPM